MLNRHLLALALIVTNSPMVLAQPLLSGDTEYLRAETALRKKDGAAATALFESAAKQGHAEAAYRLGGFYYRGQNVKESMPSAILFYKQAADAGHAHANFLVAMHTMSDTKVQQGDEIVRRYVVRGAERGDADAQALLGNFYENGELVRRDLVTAWCWYELAARSVQSAQTILKTDQEVMQRERPHHWNDLSGQVSRLSNMAEIRDTLGKKLRSKQLAQGQQFAEGWKVTFP